MGNFKQKLVRFMSGRYGVDKLYYALFGLWFVLLLVSLFIKTKDSALYYIVNILMWGAIIVAILRSMSRQTIKRAKENAVFLRCVNRVKVFFKNLWIRLRDIGKYRYRTCRHCGCKLRLPVKRGEHTVRCPKCQKTFKVRIIL